MRPRGSRPQRLLLVLFLFLATHTNTWSQASPVRFDCDPCLDRSNYTIKAIVHGTSGDPFWQQVRAAMHQTASDLNINFIMELDEVYSPQQMTYKIWDSIAYVLDDSLLGHNHNTTQIDGLIVTVPDPMVGRAVVDAVEAGIHVFGFNVGHKVAKELGMLGFVGVDEYEAGAVAAREFLRRRDEIIAARNLTNDTTAPALGGKALFVNHNHENANLHDRLQGYNDTIYNATGVPVDEIAVNADNMFDLVTLINDKFASCDYDFVLLGGSESVTVALDAQQEHQCGYNGPTFLEYFEGGVFTITDSAINATYNTSNATNSSANVTNASTIRSVPLAWNSTNSTTNGTYANSTIDIVNSTSKTLPGGLMMIASFDSTLEITHAIQEGEMEFTLTEQQYLQSVLPVVLSTLYATTGKALKIPDDTGLYSTGPHMITRESMHTDDEIICANDAFPVCPNTLSPDEIGPATCKCLERSKIKIAGVLHGREGSQFWDSVVSASRQAALDIGVDLSLKLYQPGDAVLKEMKAQIYDYCMSGVHGIFVSIPSEFIVDAIQYCQATGTPVVSVNSGQSLSEELGLQQHVGQVEYEAGMMAGRRFGSAGINIGHCLRTELDNIALLERCHGFADGLNETGIVYGGMIDVPESDQGLYKTTVEAAVGLNATWDGGGVGLLVTSGSIDPVLYLQTVYPKIQIGAFDLVEQIFQPLGDGRVLFTIDQQQYLQGTMPVYLLGYAAYTQQFLVNPVVETGPILVEHSPEGEELTCEANLFKVCPPIPEENMNYIPNSLLYLGYAAVACIGVISMVSITFLYTYKTKNVVRAGQPMFLAMLVFGAFMIALSIIPSGIQTAYRYVQDPYTGQLTDIENPDIGAVDAACMAVHWLSGLGFVIVFSALFAKIIRVKRIYDAGRALKRKRVQARDVLMIMAVMLTLEVTLLLCWQLISPDTWQRRDTEVRFDGVVLSSVGFCQSPHSDPIQLVQSVFHVACLLFALLLSIQTRNIPSDFAESYWVLMCVLSIFQISLLAIPFGYMVRSEPGNVYFVRSITTFLETLAVLVFIVGPKMYKVITGDDSLPMSFVAGRNTSTEATIGDERHIAPTQPPVPVETEVGQHSSKGASYEPSEPISVNKGRSNGGGIQSFASSVASSDSALKSALKPAKYGPGKWSKLVGVAPAPKMESLDSASEVEFAESENLAEELTRADEVRAGMFGKLRGDADKPPGSPRRATSPEEEKDGVPPNVGSDSEVESTELAAKASSSRRELDAKSARLVSQAEKVEKVRERAIQSFDEDGKRSDADEFEDESYEQKERKKPSKPSRKKLDEANAQLVALATEISKTSTDFLRHVAKSLREDSFSSLSNSKTKFLFGDESERSMASDAKQPIYHAQFQDKINEFDAARKAFKSGLEEQKRTDLVVRGFYEAEEDGDMYFM